MIPRTLWPNGAPYAKGEEDEDIPTITPYLVEGLNNPAVIICPGGGYRIRAYHEGEPVAMWLNTLGISAFVLRYRVAPYQYPCALLDLQRAIKTVRYDAEAYAINKEKIGVLGFSAGGHLAAAAGTLFNCSINDREDEIDYVSCRPDFLILGYPVITFEEQYTHAGSKLHLLGAHPKREHEQLLCIEKRVTNETPKTFIWHTADDQSVPVENSLLFCKALSKHKIAFDFHVYTHGRHGLGLAENEPHVQSWTKDCESWFKFNHIMN